MAPVQASPIGRFIRIVALLIGLGSILIGTVFLISGMQAYLGEGEPVIHPFEHLLMAITFLNLPIGALFLYKARHSYLRGFTSYDLPDPPHRSVTLAVIGVLFVLSSATAVLMVALLFRS